MSDSTSDSQRDPQGVTDAALTELAGLLLSSNSFEDLMQQQYELDEGPCLEALSTAVIVSAEDLRDEQRWNGYPAQALVHGVRAIYSSPLAVDGHPPMGVLNPYAREPRAFDEESRRSAALIAKLTSTMITAALRHYDELTLTDHLRSALSSRSVIDQAMGIVIAMRHCTQQEAFDVLRQVSQHRNVPLREVAADLVANSMNGLAEA